MKHVLAYVTPDQTANIITKFLYRGYISIFGALVRLLSDRGASFTGSVIEEMCKIGWRPRLLVDFYFPTIGSSEAPTREASAMHVDEYVASIWGRLRTDLQEAQAQLMAEACQQKWYYDRKIGTVNVKPSDLVLVKADALKGKRKINDRWEEDTWEVVHQIMSDVPSYEVTNQHGKSCILHWNWLLLVTSDVGIPLCIDIHHAWDRCTSPTPCKTTSMGGETKMTPQENNGKAVTQWPTSKASLGWINEKLWLLPWTSTRASTKDGWRP